MPERKKQVAEIENIVKDGLSEGVMFDLRPKV